MATEHSRTAARLMVSPAVILLFLWMIVPLGMTIYFSFLRYNLLMPGMESWAGFDNYYYFLVQPAFGAALMNTLLLVGGVLIITVFGGILHFGMIWPAAVLLSAAAVLLRPDFFRRLLRPRWLRRAVSLLAAVCAAAVLVIRAKSVPSSMTSA